jgi:hypothetical protein
MASAMPLKSFWFETLAEICTGVVAVPEPFEDSENVYVLGVVPPASWAVICASVRATDVTPVVADSRLTAAATVDALSPAATVTFADFKPEIATV